MSTSIKMVLSYNNNEKAVQVPVIPNELPEIAQKLSNSEFETHTKTLTLMGNKKPRTISLDLFLPTHDYGFAVSDNGEEVLELIEYACENKIPMRLVITDGLTEVLNIAVSVSSYNYKYDTVKDIRLTAELSEYMFITDSTSTADSSDTTEDISFTTTTIYVGDTSASVKSYNNDGTIYVYARAVLEFLDGSVGWDASVKKVTYNGNTLDITTAVYDGCAYVPIRELAAAIGYDIEYNSEDKSITLSTS